MLLLRLELSIFLQFLLLFRLLGVGLLHHAIILESLGHDFLVFLEKLLQFVHVTQSVVLLGG